MAAGSLPPNVDLEESQQAETLRVIIPFAVLAVLAVCARFVARRIQKLRYELDDYLSVAGLVRNNFPLAFLLFSLSLHSYTTRPPKV